MNHESDYFSFPGYRNELWSGCGREGRDRWSYEYMKIIHVNCGVKNYMKVDHRSYRRNFRSCEKEAWKGIVRDSNPWPLRHRCSALLIKLTSPTESRSLNWFVINPWKGYRLSFREICVYNFDGLLSSNCVATVTSDVTVASVVTVNDRWDPCLLLIVTYFQRG